MCVTLRKERKTKAFSRSRFVNHWRKKGEDQREREGGERERDSVVRNGWNGLMITADVPFPYQTVTRFCSNLHPGPFFPSIFPAFSSYHYYLISAPSTPSARPPHHPFLHTSLTRRLWPHGSAVKSAVTSTTPCYHKLCVVLRSSPRHTSHKE